jgi:glycerol-3-phosphate acyltransferase PlsX
MYEGVSKTFLKVMKEAFLSSLKSKIGAALALPALKKKLRAFDATQYGGAPLLGLNGLIVKTHGSAKAKEVTNSIIQCISFKEQKINEKIRESFSQDDK